MKDGKKEEKQEREGMGWGEGRIENLGAEGKRKIRKDRSESDEEWRGKEIEGRKVSRGIETE